MDSVLITDVFDMAQPVKESSIQDLMAFKSLKHPFKNLDLWLCKALIKEGLNVLITIKKSATNDLFYDTHPTL